jgi:hypothetical protein
MRRGLTKLYVCDNVRIFLKSIPLTLSYSLFAFNDHGLRSNVFVKKTNDIEYVLRPSQKRKEKRR